MEWFLLNHNSIGRLSTVILCVMIAVFLSLKRPRAPEPRFFAWYFLLASFFHVGYFIAYTVYAPEGAVGWILTAFGPMALVCFAQFAYRFPRRLFRTESYIVAALTAIVVCIGLGDYLYHYVNGYIFWTDFCYGPDYISKILPVSSVFLYLWIIIIFIRQSIHISRKGGDRRSLLQLLLFPADKDARTAQHFAVAVSAELLLCLSLAIQAVFRPFSLNELNNLQDSGFLLIYLSYIIIYVNNASKPTSLLVKMISISLVMVFLSLTAAGQLGLSRMTTVVEGLYQTRTSGVISNYRDHGSSVPDDVSFIVTRPASDGRFGSRFTLLFARDEKFDLLRLQEREFSDRDSSRGLVLRQSALDPSRSVDAASGMRVLPGKGVAYFFFTQIAGDTVYYVGYDYRIYRNHLHDVAFPFFVLYLVSTAVILFFFPILFRMSVLTPIRRIMFGVKIVKEGNLDIELPVLSDDEIGFMTKAFNQMVLSLKMSKKYQDHYSLQLEHAFLKIENSRKEVEENFEELRRTHTALAESESRYKTLNAELELRVADRTSRLEHANEELVSALIKLKDAQDGLIRTEKMAALGDMVAGVAHEINTPLGVAITAASLIDSSMKDILKRFEEGSMTKGDLQRCIDDCCQSSEIIQSNLCRAGELVQSFKLVAADQSSEERRSFDLCEYVRDVLVSLHPRLKKGGHKVEVLSDGPVHVYSYPGSFSQIVTNFIVNSLFHAYPDRNDGTMTISIRTSDGYLFFVYEDDGCGISPEYVDKIFIPFFTTKRQSGGTGLGLHVVYNIVTQKLAGTIDVASEPGQGVSFLIRIPLSLLTLPEQP